MGISSQDAKYLGRNLSKHKWIEQTFSSKEAEVGAKIREMSSDEKGRRAWSLAKFFWGAWCLVFVLLDHEVMADERVTLNFDPDWKFIKADPPGAQGPVSMTAVGRRFPRRILTMTWTRLIIYRRAGCLAIPTNGPGALGIAKRSRCRESFQGRKIYIEFEAVRQVAEVYLNGHYLGACKNGFIPFGFDLTPYAQFGKPNVLAVMCDNRFMISQTANGGADITEAKNTGEAGANVVRGDTLSAYEKRSTRRCRRCERDSGRSNSLEQSQWHPPLGGIYRNVRLYVTDPLHISLPLYDFLKTTGPYVYATEISSQSAAVTVEVPVQNGRAARVRRSTVQCEILDRDGKYCRHSGPNRATRGGRAKRQPNFPASSNIRNSGSRIIPIFITSFVRCSPAGKRLIRAKFRLGIRAVHWDIQTGFWINGHHLKLHGWGQRPTDEWPGLGTAQPDWLHYYTLQLMKEAGGNFIRWGHCCRRTGDDPGRR